MTRTTVRGVGSLPWNGAAPIRALAAGLAGALVNTATIRLVKLSGIPPGPGWLRGMVFCQVPWLLQAFVVLPWTGAGMLGLHLSPMTPIASFLLNGLFGVTLGLLYRPRLGSTQEDHTTSNDAAPPSPATRSGTG